MHLFSVSLNIYFLIELPISVSIAIYNTEYTQAIVSVYVATVVT